MRSYLSLLFVSLLLAGCGPAPTLIPQGSQPGTQPSATAAATATTPPIATASPSPAGALPVPSETGPAAAPAPIAGPDDAIRLAQQKFPELSRFQKKPPASIGASSDIVVQERAGGWNIIFWQGSGDCPAGCINNHYWYVSVEKTGSVSLAGEFVREYNSASYALTTRGAPMWGLPRQ